MAESEDLFGSQEEDLLNTLMRNEEINKKTMEVEPISNEESTNKEKSAKVPKLTELPLSRVKSIMKIDPDVHMASQESVFLVAKAAELFLNSLVKETAKFTVKAKRKTVQRPDLDAAIENLDSLVFLEGALD